MQTEVVGRWATDRMAAKKIGLTFIFLIQFPDVYTGSFQSNFLLLKLSAVYESGSILVRFTEACQKKCW